LEGVRVVDLTRILAGPFCTMLLGDLGAEVIKVELPGRGDDTRQWGPPFAEGGESAYFLAANRNKRSLTLNLKTERGLQILRELIRRADVLVENFRVGTLQEWGLDYEALQALRPGLVYCTITGYGYTGPYRDRPGYDFIAQAEGGFMSVTGPVEGEPTRAGVAITDMAAGMFACSAVLAALFARQRTGRGQWADIALLDSQVALMSYVASNYLVSGERPRRYGNAHPNIVPYQAFQARDGYFAFAAGNDRQWAAFCQAVGRSDWTEDPRFATNPSRNQNRAPLLEQLGELFRQHDIAHWISLCETIGLPAAPINDIAGVFEHPQVQARGMVQHLPHPTAGSVPLLASPLRLVTSPAPARLPPPLLGQHTQEILGEWLGYDEAAVQTLRQEGVV
jgi:formyl-CoA transferase